MTFTAFLLFIAAGLACGFMEGLNEPLRHKSGIVFTVITDVIIAFASVALHAVIIYFKCDGQIFFYAVCAQIIAFLISRSLAAKLACKVAAKVVKNKKPRPDKKRRGETAVRI